MKYLRYKLRFALFATTIFVGCTGSKLPIVPTTGKVTYGGGEWPADGTIFFTPISVEEGYPRRPATGRFKSDGAFKVTSFKPDDGLVPGTYSVKVTCYEKQPDASNQITFETYNLVPKDFKPDDVVVETTAQTVTVEFDVPKKK